LIIIKRKEFKLFLSIKLLLIHLFELIIIIIFKLNSLLSHLYYNERNNDIIYLNIKQNISQILNKEEIINNYLSSIPSKYYFDKQYEKEKLQKLLSLKTLSKSQDDPLNSQIKSKLLKEINALSYGKNFSFIKILYIYILQYLLFLEIE